MRHPASQKKPNEVKVARGLYRPMTAADALEAVRLMSPKLVIPCHYNVPFLWIKKMAVANGEDFKRRVEDMGIECRIMKEGDMVEL